MTKLLRFTAWGILVLSSTAWAKVTFRASLDRDQITLDETVSLRLQIESDGTHLQLGEPSFAAPGLDVISSNEQNFMQSFYDNGSFGVRNVRTLLKVLQPHQKGRLDIRDIEILVNGKKLKASDLHLDVISGSALGANPNGAGKRGGGSVLRSQSEGKNYPYFLKAEIAKQEVFKGEQLIVNYYLYEQTRIFNFEIKKYPILKGFLREELQMPVVKGNPMRESVIVNGTPYQKSLLLQYAAYPLQTGELKLDELDMRADYYPRQRGGLDQDDDPFMGFFRSMTPSRAAKSSEALQIKVLPLPEAGRPSDYSGAVGEFTISVAADRLNLKANEALNLVVKIEGRGNLANIKDLTVTWPNQMDLYDSKGRSKTDVRGISEKIYEYLLIPRKEGTYIIPSFEFAYFDPKTQRYRREKSEPLTVRVAPGDGSPSGALSLTGREEGKAISLTAEKPKLRGPHYQPEERQNSSSSIQESLFGHGAYWGGLGLLAFGLWVAIDRRFRKRKTRGMLSILDRLNSLEKNLDQLKTDIDLSRVLQILEGMEALLFDSLDSRFGVRSRTLSRELLREALVAQGKVGPDYWSRVERFLEGGERLRFSGALAKLQQGASSELKLQIQELRFLISPSEA